MRRLSILMAFISFTAAAQSQLLLRYPAINNNGSLISFSYQGDIWTVPATGGKATRLTIHEGYEGMPVFSPDGKTIAFSGARFGNNDIFTIPVEGGLPKRLTYHSAGDLITSWSNDGRILFSTNRDFKQIERPSEVYAINSNGGTESRILDAVGFESVLSPSGRFLAFVRGDINPTARKDYKGSSNRDIWIYDTQLKAYNKLNLFETNDVMPLWGDNNTLYFLSSNDGEYNIYKLGIDAAGKATGKPDKLTSYGDESIRHQSISADGKTIVFEKDMNIYTFNTASKRTSKVDISINADDRFDATENKTLSSGANEYAVSPNGKLFAFAVRGEVYIKEADKEKTRSINVSNHSYRDYQPVWLNDSSLLFASDRNDGNFDFYLVRSSDTTERNIFKSFKHDITRVTNTALDESDAVVSGDGKKVAYSRGRGTFVVADISADGKLSNEKIITNNGYANAGDVAWSPDNKWIAYSWSDLNFNQEVFITAADNSTKPVNVSMHPRGDGNPYWSADGSKLGFISERSYSSGNDIYFVWLKKEDWEKQQQDWREMDPPADGGDKAKDKKSPKPIKIDLDKIHERVVQVTSLPGNEGDLIISKDGETFYYTAGNSDAKGRDLYSIKWDGRDLKELTKGGSNPGGITMDKEGKYLYYVRSGGLNRMDVKTSVSEGLPYAAKLKIDYTQERTQVYEEAWRTMRDGFYDPQMHGTNWNKLHDKYKERCVQASTSKDFSDMFNLLLGELNSSHQGMTPADRTETNRDVTGLLGVELTPVSNGVRVAHVIPGTAADKVASKLNTGDVITAVNGDAVNANENFYGLLSETVNEKIILNVTGTDGKQREVAIRPTGNNATALYNEWVDARKKLVEKYSGGRLGYIHIRGMDFPSFETVEREFTAAGYGKEGLVIDVRYNGGGSTTDYLMTILNYKQHAYTIPRGASNDLEKDKLKFREYYPTGERLVYAAWTKPSIAMCNEGSYSNAEIFAHAYKTLGIGKVVGVPTNGSVISTGGRALMDGSFVRLPFRGWFTKATDKNQELGAAVPDIIVDNQPDWISKDIDAQLKAAVDELLKELKK